MKRLIAEGIAIAVVGMALSWGYTAEAASSGVRINEVLPDPEGNEYDNEFIEIKKPASTDISGWKLILQKENESVEEADTLTIEDTYTGTEFAVIDEQLSQDLYNGGMTVRISEPQLENADHTRLAYTSSIEEGISKAFDADSGTYMYMDPTKGAVNGEQNGQSQNDDSSNKQESNEDSTNDTEDSDKNTYIGPKTLTISRVVPNPEGDEPQTEVFEIRNYGSEPIDLSGWHIRERRGADMESVEEYSLPKQTIEADSSLRLENQRPPLINDPDFGVLFSVVTPDEQVTDTVLYQSAPEGEALVRAEDDTMRWQDVQSGSDDSEPPQEKQTTGNITISELFPAPKQKGKTEFIELRNKGDEPVNLDGWTLTDNSKDFSLSAYHSLPAGGYLLLRKSETGLALNNSGTETVTLTNSEGEQALKVSYTDARSGQSYTRTDEAWQWSATLTPKAANVVTKPVKTESSNADKKKSQTTEDTELPTVDSDQIRLTEVFPDPNVIPDRFGEFVEVQYTGEKERSLKGWILEIQSINESREEASQIQLSQNVSENTRLNLWSLTSSLRLPNAGATLRLRSPQGNVVSQISYEDAKTAHSYSRFSEENMWRWTDRVTPGKDNQQTSSKKQSSSQSSDSSQTSPTSTKSSADNSKERSDSQTGSDQQTDAKKSTRTEKTNEKEKTSPSKSPQETKSEETPRATDADALRITEIFAYPEGDQAKNEFIEMKYTGKEDRSLKGWQLTDGVNTFTFDDRRPDSDTRLVLGREETGIALRNNRKETLKLRTPSGEVIQSVKREEAYTGESYARKEESWHHTETVTPGKANTITQSDKNSEENETTSEESVDESSSQDTNESEAEEIPRVMDVDALRITEVLAYPKGDQAENEFIEMKYTGKEDRSLKGWQLTDGVNTFTFEDRRPSPGNYITLPRSQTGIALQNHHQETLKLIPPEAENPAQTLQHTPKEHGVGYALKDGEWKHTTDTTAGASNTIRALESEPKEESSSEKEHERTALKTVAAAYEVSDEEKIRLEGQVFIPPHVLSNRFFVVSDSERSIKVYNYEQEFPDLEWGSHVSIDGKVSITGEDTRISADTEGIEVEESGNVAPPKPVNGNQTGITSSVQGQRVTLTGELLEQNGDDMYVRTNANKRLRVTILPTTSLEKPDMRAGDTISVSGLVDVYRESVRIPVWHQSHLQVHTERSKDKEDSEDTKEESGYPASTQAQERSSYTVDELIDERGSSEVSSNQSGPFPSPAQLTAYIPQAGRDWLREHPWVSLVALLGVIWGAAAVILWRGK